MSREESAYVLRCILHVNAGIVRLPPQRGLGRMELLLPRNVNHSLDHGLTRFIDFDLTCEQEH